MQKGVILVNFIHFMCKKSIGLQEKYSITYKKRLNYDGIGIKFVYLQQRIQIMLFNPTKMQYKNFSAVKNYKDFLLGGHILLIQTLGNFFSATVRLHFEPLRELMPAYNID